MAGYKTNEKLSNNSFCRRAYKLQVQRKSIKNLRNHMSFFHNMKLKQLKFSKLVI